MSEYRQEVRKRVAEEWAAAVAEGLEGRELKKHLWGCQANSWHPSPRFARKVWLEEVRRVLRWGLHVDEVLRARPRRRPDIPGQTKLF